MTMISINDFIPQNLEMSIPELKLGLQETYYERCGKAHEKESIVGRYGSSEFLWKCPFTRKNKNVGCAHDNLFHKASEKEILENPEDQRERYHNVSNRAYVGNLLRFVLNSDYVLGLSMYREVEFYGAVNYAADRLVASAQPGYISSFPSQGSGPSLCWNVYPVLKKDFGLNIEADCIQVCKSNIRSCLSLLNIEFSQEGDMVSMTNSVILTSEQEKSFYSHTALLEEVSGTGFMSIRNRGLAILESKN